MTPNEACLAKVVLREAESALRNAIRLTNRNATSRRKAFLIRSTLKEIRWKLIDMKTPDGSSEALEYIFKGKLEKLLRLSDDNLTRRTPSTMSAALSATCSMRDQVDRLAEDAESTDRERDLMDEISVALKEEGAVEQSAKPCISEPTVVLDDPQRTRRALRKKFE